MQMSGGRTFQAEEWTRAMAQGGVFVKPGWCDWEGWQEMNAEATPQGPFELDTSLLSPYTHLPPCSAAWEADVYGPCQQAPLTSGFLWDLANGRHLQEIRGQESSLPRWPSAAWSTPVHFRLGVGVPNASPGLPAPGNQIACLVASLNPTGTSVKSSFSTHSPNSSIWVWHPPVFLPGS